MREILLWAHLDIMPSAETILVIDGPMHYSCNLSQDTFTITSMSGPMHWSWFQPIWCFCILADAVLLVIFAQLAEICWLNVIRPLYMLGLVVLSVCFDWIMSSTGMCRGSVTYWHSVSCQKTNSQVREWGWGYWRHWHWRWGIDTQRLI